MSKLVVFLKKYFTAEGHAQIDQARRQRRNNGASTGTSTPSSTGHDDGSNWPTGGNPRRGHRTPPSGVTVSDRPIGQQRPARRTRRRRRTASPVGLPLYSEEPIGDEMSLFKHQTEDLRSSSRLELTLSPTIEVDHAYEDEEADEEEEEVAADSASEFVRPSFDNSASDHGGHQAFLALSPTTSLLPHHVTNRPRSASDSLARISSRHPYGSNSSSPFASRSGLIDLPPGNLNPNSLSPTVSRDGTSTPPRTVYGHRPTRSSPISRRASSPPRPTLGRPRASTLQRVLGGSNSSSGFLPIGTKGRSPYGQGQGGSGANSPVASRSLQRFATGSTTSINTLDISEPVPGSFVHSSFVFPKTGPTPDQVRFIASRENLGAYGYFGQSPSEPPPFEPSQSTSLSPPSPSSSPLALPDIGVGLGRPISMVQANHQQGRGRSGSASSPLARRRSPSPPLAGAEEEGIRRHSLARETSRSSEEEAESRSPDVELPFTVDEDEPESSTADSQLSTGELPPIVPLSPISPTSPHSYELPIVSSANSHVYPTPPSFNRMNTSSPPPMIVTQAATPSNSAHPSPAIPQHETFETLRKSVEINRDDTLKLR